MILVFLGVVFFVIGIDAECPLGWQHYEQKCYWFSTITHNWHAAATSCGVHGAQLAEVETSAENDYLKYFAKVYGHNYWLGGNDEIIDGQWTWAGSDDPLGFTDWYQNEPNGARNEDCLAISKSGGYHWVDTNCAGNNNYICEKSYPNSGQINVIG